MSYNNILFADVNMVSKFRDGGYFDVDGVYHNYLPVNLINLKFSYKRAYYTVYMQVDNITNVRYYDFGWVPMPGRFYRAGIVVEVDKL